MIGRLLIAALLALTVSATEARAWLAQSTSAPPAGYQGPGDLVSGAAAWWGLRAYSNAWADGTHVAIRVERSDTSQCDVLLDTNGKLGNTSNCAGGIGNGTAIVTYCTAVPPCHVNTFYDQTGNGRYVTLGTYSTQPVLHPNATVSSVSAEWVTSVTNALCSAASFSEPQIVSLSTVYEVTGGTGIESVINGNAANWAIAKDSSANTVTLYAGSLSADATASDNSYHAIQAIFNGASSQTYVDGSSTTGLNPGTGSSSSDMTCIGNNGAGTSAFVGHFREGGVWPNSVAASFNSHLAALNTNQHAYWGF